MRKVLLTFVPGLIAACIGGLVGYYPAEWLLRQGRHASVIPGAIAGLACGFCSVDHSRARGALCALIALFAGLLTYWKLWQPAFKTDGSFLDLVVHCHQLSTLTQIELVLGAVLGFWWGRETTNPWRHRFSKTGDES